ncbi:unnamed protein product [Echinostoma caproni]|uniref:TIP41-like protein n=1 Tax=Echinostoma caproni TaxID=27848 RepID=A0A183B7N5_9TREM|nr:unnamed protein product [Echinostoma caproni]
MGGFKLIKWTSNSLKATDCIPVEKRSPCLRDLKGSPLPTDKALGVQWDSENDEFLFQLQLPEETVTRKGVLSSSASLYNPMGFVAPWLLPGKILLQDLCRKNVTWDETLFESDHKTWQGRTVEHYESIVFYFGIRIDFGYASFNCDLVDVHSVLLVGEQF